VIGRQWNGGSERLIRPSELFGGVTGLATIVGPILGGAIAEGAPWQWIFWINVPMAAVVIPLAMRGIDESFGARAGPDIVGLALVTLGALGLVWGLMRGSLVGWASAEALTANVAGLLLVATFAAREARTSEPMTPMRFFRSRAFASGIAASTLFYASMYGVLFILPQFFQNWQNLGALAAGLRLLPRTATLLVMAPVAGGFVKKVGVRRLVVIGLVLQFLGMARIGAIASPELAYIQLVPPLLLAGCGVSMAMPAAQHAVLGSVAAGEIGKASGTFNMMRYLGGAFGIALVGAVFAGRGVPDSAKAFCASWIAPCGLRTEPDQRVSACLARSPVTRQRCVAVSRRPQNDTRICGPICRGADVRKSRCCPDSPLQLNRQLKCGRRPGCRFNILKFSGSEIPSAQRRSPLNTGPVRLPRIGPHE